MRRLPFAVRLVLISWCASGCELVLGPLPTPCEELGACTGAAVTTGGAGSGATSGTTGGTGGGATAGGGMGGSTSTGTDSTTGGTGGGTTSTADPCDADGDGVLAESCGGADCNDDKAGIPAGEAQYFTVPDEVVGFDYDCSKFLELDPAHDVGIECSGALGAMACEGKGKGYLDNMIPACGQPGVWGECQWIVNLVGSCKNKPINTQEIMPCH